MDSLREFPAQMYLISSAHSGQLPPVLADGSGLEGDLNLGIDLSWFPIDTLDMIPHADETENQSIGEIQFSSSNSQAAFNQTGLDLDDLEVLDFEISDDLLATLNQFENFNNIPTPIDPNSSQSFMTDVTETNSSLINSPGTEITLADIMGSMESAPTTTAPSPSASDFADDDLESSADSSSPGTPMVRNGFRRTRGRTIDKKQSNKVAAVKYRNKKLKEREILFAECEDYEKKNAELKRKIEDTQTEISFIKSLLVEALIGKKFP